MERWILCVLCPQITHSIQNAILYLLSANRRKGERLWRVMFGETIGVSGFWIFPEFKDCWNSTIKGYLGIMQSNLPPNIYLFFNTLHSVWSPSSHLSMLSDGPPISIIRKLKFLECSFVHWAPVHHLIKNCHLVLSSVQQIGTLHESVCWKRAWNPAPFCLPNRAPEGLHLPRG